jgi:hypothetical protein
VKSLLATNHMGKLNMANLDKKLVNFLDSPTPLRIMWSLHNPFFLLQNGEFMAQKKKKKKFPNGKKHV